VVAALAALVVLGAACGQSGTSAAPSPSASTAAAASTAPASQAAAPCDPFRGGVVARTSSGPVAPGQLVDAVAGAAGCLDRVEFTFRSLGDNTVAGQGLPPGYQVEYTDTDHFMDGQVAIVLPGNAFLTVTMKPASSFDTTDPTKPRPTYLGNASLRWTQFHHLEVVRRLQDGPDSVQWVIGLDGKRPFLVDAARDPTRITIWIG
jgi:hypothetical protein